MRDLKPHFEIFIKVNWLLNGEILSFRALLCKEIVKKSQKFLHKQGGYKINDKFAFSESASDGIVTPFAANFKKIIELLQQLGDRSALNSFFNYLNPFIPFTLLKHQVLTVKVKAYAGGINTKTAFNKNYNN